MEQGEKAAGAARIRVPEQIVTVQRGEGEPLTLTLEEQLVSARVALGGAGDGAVEHLSARVTIGDRRLSARVRD